MTPRSAHAMGEFFDWTYTLDAWRNESPMQQRYAKCQEEDGLWAEEIIVSPCTDNVATIYFHDEAHHQRCDSGTGATFGQQCVHFDEAQQAYFNDGPSIPHNLQIASTALGDSYDLLRWNAIFWPAGVNHDYCYGYNPVTYGHTREACDMQFLEDLASICKHEPHRGLAWFSEDICEWYAALMYSAVSISGESAWNAQNSEVYYGDWKPLWQAYDLPEQPSTEHVQFYINMSASAVSWSPIEDWLWDDSSH